jgi:Protein of unknown function (DUF559)
MDDLPPRPFTTQQARAAGLPYARLESAVEAGRVRRVMHGVYLRTDLPLTLDRKLAAAALVIAPNAVACDRTAAWIWGVDVHVFRELDVVPPVETVVLSGCARTKRPQTRGGERALLPCDWTEVDGIKVTTPLRTAMDLACGLNRREAIAALDGLMRVHPFTSADIARVLPRYRRRRGVVQLRELAPLADPGAESPRESWTRMAMLDFGLPPPALQWWVTIDGTPTYRLDLAYPHARIAVEYDGSEHHTSPDDVARDAVRRDWLREHGWTVIVVDRTAFEPDADTRWLEAIREALDHAQRAVRRVYGLP